MENTSTTSPTSFVMLSLSEYEDFKNQILDLKNRNTQVSDSLMKFEYFLKSLNSDEDVIEKFNKNLEKYDKIGSALFDTYEYVKDKMSIKL